MLVPRGRLAQLVRAPALQRDRRNPQVPFLVSLTPNARCKSLLRIIPKLYRKSPLLNDAVDSLLPAIFTSCFCWGRAPGAAKRRATIPNWAISALPRSLDASIARDKKTLQAASPSRKI